MEPGARLPVRRVNFRARNLQRARPHRAREQVCRPFSRLPGSADRSSVACGAQRMESHSPHRSWPCCDTLRSSHSVQASWRVPDARTSAGSRRIQARPSLRPTAGARTDGPLETQRFAALALLDGHAHAWRPHHRSVWRLPGQGELVERPLRISRTGFVARLARWRFAADVGSVLANRHPPVCGVFQQLPGGWVVMTLNGVASAAYNAAEWSNVSAMVSADCARARAGLSQSAR